MQDLDPMESGKVLAASISSMFFLEALRLTCTSDGEQQAHGNLDLVVRYTWMTVFQTES